MRMVPSPLPVASCWAVGSMATAEIGERWLRGDYLLRELDLIRVRGRKAPVPLYEVLEASATEERGDIEAMLPVFAEGLDHYRARAWRTAMQCFARVLELQPRDGPAGVYLQRCRQFLEQPPAASWKGIWQAGD